MTKAIVFVIFYTIRHYILFLFVYIHQNFVFYFYIECGNIIARLTFHQKNAKITISLKWQNIQIF